MLSTNRNSETVWGIYWFKHENNNLPALTDVTAAVASVCAATVVAVGTSTVATDDPLFGSGETPIEVEKIRCYWWSVRLVYKPLNVCRSDNIPTFLSAFPLRFPQYWQYSRETADPSENTGLTTTVQFCSRRQPAILHESSDFARAVFYCGNLNHYATNLTPLSQCDGPF